MNQYLLFSFLFFRDYVITRSVGYFISTNDSPSAGAECPARQRSWEAMTSAICCSVIRPRPTSKSVPTTARTMFLRNRSAEMTKYASCSFSITHRASLTSQIVVFTSVCVRQNEAKSCLPISSCAALFIASKSKPFATRV